MPELDNFLMISPDDLPMARIDKKRAEWYLKKNLATKINEDTIKLLFIPKGNGRVKEPYYLQKIENICVICGSNKDITKHHIVPYRYRKFFDLELKSHSSYDVLLVCRKCHDSYEKEVNIIKTKVFEQFTGLSFLEQRIKLKKQSNAISCAKSLLNNNLHKRAKEKCIFKVEEYLGRKLTEEDVLKLSKIEIKGSLDGDFLVNKLKESSKIDEFILFWRKHFIEKTKPKFLPKYWLINE